MKSRGEEPRMQASTPAPRPMGQDRGEAASLSQLDSDAGQPTRREQGSRGSTLDRVRGGLSSPGETWQPPVEEEEAAPAESRGETNARQPWPFFARFEWMIALRYLRARRKE